MNIISPSGWGQVTLFYWVIPSGIKKTLKTPHWKTLFHLVAFRITLHVQYKLVHYFTLTTDKGRTRGKNPRLHFVIYSLYILQDNHFSPWENLLVNKTQRWEKKTGKAAEKWDLLPADGIMGKSAHPPDEICGNEAGERLRSKLTTLSPSSLFLFLLFYRIKTHIK